jgi:hypothetical protein
VSLSLALDFQNTTSVEKLWSDLPDSNRRDGAKYGWSKWYGELEKLLGLLV